MDFWSILNNIIWWVLLFLVVIGIFAFGIAYYFLKKYHYPPVQKFPFKVHYKEPRNGRLEKVFTDRFCKIWEKEGKECLLTMKERLRLPVKYMEHMEGNELTVHSFNRYETFPFAMVMTDTVKKFLGLKTVGTPEDEARKRLVALEKFETVEYKELLSPEAVESFYAGHRSDQVKYAKTDWYTKVAPFATIAVTGFMVLLIIVVFMSQVGEIAESFTLASQNFKEGSANYRAAAESRGTSTAVNPEVPGNAPPY